MFSVVTGGGRDVSHQCWLVNKYAGPASYIHHAADSIVFCHRAISISHLYCYAPQISCGFFSLCLWRAIYLVSPAALSTSAYCLVCPGFSEHCLLRSRIFLVHIFPLYLTTHKISHPYSRSWPTHVSQQVFLLMIVSHDIADTCNRNCGQGYFLFHRGTTSALRIPGLYDTCSGAPNVFLVVFFCILYRSTIESAF